MRARAHLDDEPPVGARERAPPRSAGTSPARTTRGLPAAGRPDHRQEPRRGPLGQPGDAAARRAAPGRRSPAASASSNARRPLYGLRRGRRLGVQAVRCRRHLPVGGGQRDRRPRNAPPDRRRSRWRGCGRPTRAGRGLNSRTDGRAAMRRACRSGRGSSRQQTPEAVDVARPRDAGSPRSASGDRTGCGAARALAGRRAGPGRGRCRSRTGRRCPPRRAGRCAGFTSRWITPCRWAVDSACATWSIRRPAAIGVERARRHEVLAGSRRGGTA